MSGVVLPCDWYKYPPCFPSSTSASFAVIVKQLLMSSFIGCILNGVFVVSIVCSVRFSVLPLSSIVDMPSAKSIANPKRMKNVICAR